MPTPARARRPLPFAVCLFALALPAQEAAKPVDAAAGKALQQALLATARAGATSFAAEWRWPELRARGAPAELENPPLEHQTGTFADDVLFVRCDDEAGRWQAWQLGRVCAVSHGDGPWQLASRRTRPYPGDGKLGDPLLLLLGLAEHQLPVAQRTIAERDGRAVERYSIVLDQPTTARLSQVGAIRDPQPSTQIAQQLIKAGMIKATDVPNGHVDLCIELDVATRTVRRVHLRALQPQVNPTDLVQRARGGRADEAEQAPATPAAAAAKPLEFVDGLPMRDTNELHELRFVIQFGDAGKAERPQPDAEVRHVLGG